MKGNSADLTVLLRAYAGGDPSVEESLVGHIYPILRRLAARQLAGERAIKSFATTDLAHEAYLELFRGADIHWQDRRHFVALAARIVRRVVVDFARQNQSQKRGQGAVMLAFEDLSSEPPAEQKTAEVLALAEALDHLGEIDPEAARITELRYFGGFNLDEISDFCDLSTATVGRRWRFAKAWLRRHLA